MPFAPRTWTSNELVTAALMNSEIRDLFNLTAPGIVTTLGDLVAASAANTIGRLAAVAGRHLIADSGEPLGLRWSEIQYAEVDTSEGTTSTSYTDLATAGPEITIDVGSSGVAEVRWGFRHTNSGTNENFCGVRDNANDPSGKSEGRVNGVSSITKAHYFYRRFTGLTPGNNTFKLRYKTASGTGTFAQRWIEGYSL